jgi:GrpB-like predicted nucleotidyltransferase (UPF0157 family)
VELPVGIESGTFSYESSSPGAAYRLSMVEVVDYRPSWPRLYTAESAVVIAALGSRCGAIEHIGSTAVPGLAAKPIIDILVGASPEPLLRDRVGALSATGYEALGEDGRRPGRWMFQKRAVHSFNLSIVPLGGRLWRDNLVFRDFLRSSEDARARYAEVKRRAAATDLRSLQDYQDHKRADVEQLKVEARAWARSRRLDLGHD